ncbi:unnamed protein product [Allacma fusca]|uniref:Uncharacterized protein n=1 Tax=Allacma fusca TaxID=39272 RepID=A0A8J2L0E7_9HEXA|nr:unnamed protein product [Allacma fusca]
MLSRMYQKSVLKIFTAIKTKLAKFEHSTDICWWFICRSLRRKEFQRCSDRDNHQRMAKTSWQPNLPDIWIV